MAASPDARANIVLLVEELEPFNFTTDPGDKPDILCGRWRLVFTNSLDVLSLGLLAPVELIAEVYENIALAEEKEWDFEMWNVFKMGKGLGWFLMSVVSYGQDLRTKRQNGCLRHCRIAYPLLVASG